MCSITKYQTASRAVSTWASDMLAYISVGYMINNCKVFLAGSTIETHVQLVTFVKLCGGAEPFAYLGDP